MTIPQVCCVLLILAIAVATDLKSRIIPNKLTLPGLVLGLAYHTLIQGWDGFVFSISGLGLGFGLMIVPFMINAMGGGDVKLMACLGAWLGAKLILAAFIATSIVGGIYALVVLAVHRGGIRAFNSSLLNCLLLAPGGKVEYSGPSETMRLPKLCYGLAIALGTILVMAWSLAGERHFVAFMEVIGLG